MSALLALRYKIAVVAVALVLAVVAIYGYGAFKYRAGRLDADLKWTTKIAEVRAANMLKQAEAQSAINERGREHAAYVMETNGMLAAFRSKLESGHYNDENSSTSRACVAVPKRMSVDLNAVGRTPGTGKGR